MSVADRLDNTRFVTVSALQLARNLAKHPSFQSGYNSAIKGEEYNYEIESKAEAITYARGRAFAVWIKSQKLKGCRWKNGVLSKAAQDRLLIALQVRAIL
jgi:hypothetical protein